MQNPVCCNPSHTCFEKNGGYGACLDRCEPGIHWSEPPAFRTWWTCRRVGAPAPPPPPPPPPPTPTPAPSPPGQCSPSSYTGNGGCLRIPTCCDPNHRCFMKNNFYAQCMAQCTAGVHWDDPPDARTPWSCTPVAGTNPGPSPPPPTPAPTPAPTPTPTPPPTPSPPSGAELRSAVRLVDFFRGHTVYSVISEALRVPLLVTQVFFDHQAIITWHQSFADDDLTFRLSISRTLQTPHFHINQTRIYCHKS